MLARQRKIDTYQSMSQEQLQELFAVPFVPPQLTQIDLKKQTISKRYLIGMIG